jgi:hypothetical protein
MAPVKRRRAGLETGPGHLEGNDARPGEAAPAADGDRPRQQEETMIQNLMGKEEEVRFRFIKEHVPTLEEVDI